MAATNYNMCRMKCSPKYLFIKITEEASNQTCDSEARKKSFVHSITLRFM